MTGKADLSTTGSQGRGLKLRHRARRIVILLALVPGLLACTAQKTVPALPVLEIDGLRMVNRTALPIQSARIRVPATEGFVSCGFIPAGGFCSTTFPELTYSGNPIEISWQQATGAWTLDPVTMDVSQEVQAAGRAQLEIVIVGPGSAAALLLAD